MTTQPIPESTMLDLAGLPDPVVRSIRQLVASLRSDVPKADESAPRIEHNQYYGCLAGLNLTVSTDADLDEVRREMWANFPRDVTDPGAAMTDVLSDTNAIIWYLADPTKLTAPAAARMNAAVLTGRVFLASITFVEMTYLVEKSRIHPGILSKLWTVVRDPLAPFRVLPLTLDVADTIRTIPRDMVPDMPDRIITATAIASSLPLVTSDGKIRGVVLPGLSVVW